MPDDRLGDLGAPEPRKRSAAERFVELDETSPEPDSPKRRAPEPARPGGRYMWVVGVAALILISVAMLRTISSGSGEYLQGPPRGAPLPEFAAPLVDGPEADANLVPRDTKSDITPACEVRVPGSLNICAKYDKPVVMSFLFLRGAKCEPQFDRIERVRRRYGNKINVIGVFFERDRKRVREVVRKHDWNFPLVVDRDGAVTNLYAIGGCPATVFAYPGGKVRETRNGNLSERELQMLIDPLLR